MSCSTNLIWAWCMSFIRSVCLHKGNLFKSNDLGEYGTFRTFKTVTWCVGTSSTTRRRGPLTAVRHRWPTWLLAPTCGREMWTCWCPIEWISVICSIQKTPTIRWKASTTNLPLPVSKAECWLWRWCSRWLCCWPTCFSYRSSSVHCTVSPDIDECSSFERRILNSFEGISSSLSSNVNYFLIFKIKINKTSFLRVSYFVF